MGLELYECDNSFEIIKQVLGSTKVLMHFNPQLPITLSCDASATGIGAVISHTFPNWDVRPIAFASRTLSRNECNYSQIDKEALGIIFGIKKFH